MKKNELENRLAETEELTGTIEKTLVVAIDEAKRAETVKEETSRILTDILNFSKASLENASSLDDADKAKSLEDSIRRLIGWSQAENDRMRIRPQALQERVAALQSIVNWMSDRSKAHKARIAAIERAANPDRDKRHPEKLSVRRAAQELSETEEE
jgi:hypothetical protein